MTYQAYATEWNTTEVHYAPEWQVWMVTAYTAEGAQVGDSETYTLKEDAVHTAQGYKDSERCARVEVYTKAGKLI